MTNEKLSKKIADALMYYVNDTDKRCIDGTLCKYSGTSLGIRTKGCLIGQFLTPKDRYRADEVGAEDVHNLIEIAENEGINLPNFIYNNPSLMSSLQAIHDNSDNWNLKKKQGLSKSGKARIHNIIIREGFNGEHFKQML